ncbi:MAG: bifunctional phosphoribosylaminoimidazolecarboxamide formyltransferase/IMP cyclohydrolase [Candidatus Marinimicrobia bacterium]|nr:bifunctional phosphoribosylaminoimidazolecarboxamide formyltransferase/IMP cyclohydrolase [Candidatus Neomarinimicrobiota bacterium]MBL7023105.1 bifunctional phosphoribosylaminoimidazolecarboxamide formyltransferase/IMP cyclohydrolase [Candidatus Neomarinimicrobiota bacterium]
MIKRALLSVWFKDGIVELGQFLSSSGVELISTGGTQKALENAGLKVTPVSDITGTGSVMDGRVKTLDPKIFGGILADRENETHITDLQNIGGSKIDLIVVNFYPFVQEAVEKGLDFRKAIEFIDIGGPSMIRAAAKNYHSVVPLCDPKLYNDFKQQFTENDGQIPIEIRKKYATKVFSMTSQYESSIFDYFAKDDQELPQTVSINLYKSDELRYGENPHQKSAFYLPAGKEIPWEQHQGKALSFNNYADMESAIAIALQFNEPACSIIKHSNPCGFGIGKSLKEAYLRAVTTDPLSYFGGIVGFNLEVDEDTAIELVKPFLECVIAPSFSDEAKKILKKKKNLRIITITPNYQLDEYRIKSVAGGFLYQQQDLDQGELNNLKVVTNRKPTSSEFNAMKLGWILVRFVKSNAIVFANEHQLLGVGAGQMSRVDSVKIAIRKAKEAGLSLENAVIASDAFFPFPDSLELASEEGISAVIQPGGSIKDDTVIKRADELDLSMCLTKIRHFYH